MGNAPGSPAGGASRGLIARNETGVILTCGDAKLEPLHKGRTTSEGGGQGGYVRYVFYCGYGPFSWRIQCRFSEVELLRNRLARSLQTDSSRGGDSTPCPHAIGLRAPTSSFTMLPQWHETRPAFLSQRHGEIMAYLQGLAGTEAFWKHRAVKEFFEVSVRSFDPDFGQKGKEGPVQVSSGGVFGAGFTGFRDRWLIVRDGFVAWFADSTCSQPRGLFVVDDQLTFEGSKRSSSEFVLKSDQRTLFVQVRGRDPGRLVADWLEALHDVTRHRPRCCPVSTSSSSSTANNALREKSPSSSAAQPSSAVSSSSSPSSSSSSSSPSSTPSRPHRFGSFAPPRPSCPVSWYVCGRSYFGAVARALQAARRQIFIADWRLNPDILLTRWPDPPVVLKDLLLERASEGVEVYILVYKEVSEMLQKKHRTLAIAKELLRLHPNIHMLRHGSGNLMYWSHHDKIVCVDQEVAFVGGIDLTEGRFDDFLHRVGDIDTPDGRGETPGHNCLFPRDEYYQPNKPRHNDNRPSTVNRSLSSSNHSNGGGGGYGPSDSLSWSTRDGPSMRSTTIASDAASAFLSPHLDNSSSFSSSCASVSWTEDGNSTFGDDLNMSSGNNYRSQDQGTLRNSEVLVNCMDDDFRADMASGALNLAPPSAPPQDDDAVTVGYDGYYGHGHNGANGGSGNSSNPANNEGSGWAVRNEDALNSIQPTYHPAVPTPSNASPVSPPPEAESKVVTLNLKQPIGMSVSTGGVVLCVNPGEQAELCGITPGSIMVAVAGDSVQGGAEFEALLEAFTNCGLAEVELAFLQPSGSVLSSSSSLPSLSGAMATAPQYEDEENGYTGGSNGKELPLYPHADVAAVAMAAKARSQTSSSGFVVVDAASSSSSSSSYNAHASSPGLLSPSSRSRQQQQPPRLPPLIDGFIDRGRVPRQPWQDVAMGVGGTAARDVALHFVARWNHHRAAEGGLREGTQLPLPFLLPFSDNLDTDYKRGLPAWKGKIGSKNSSSNHTGIYNGNRNSSNGNSGVASGSIGTVGAATGVDVDNDNGGDEAAAAAQAAVLLATAELPNSLGALPMPVPETASSAHCEVQVLRSAGPWSLGVTPEKSIYQAWCSAIEEAEHCIYIEQQYFITSLEPEPNQKSRVSSGNPAGAATSSSSLPSVPSSTPRSSSVNGSSTALKSDTGATSSAAPATTSAADATSSLLPLPPPSQPQRFVAVVPPNAQAGSTFHVKTLHPLSGEETVSVVTVPPGNRPGDQLVIELAQPPPPPLPSYAASSVSSSSLPPPPGYPGNKTTKEFLPLDDSISSKNKETGLGAQMAGLATSVATAVVGGVATVVTGAVASVGGSIQERVDGAVQNRIGYVLWQRLRRAILEAQQQRAQGLTPKPFRVLVVLPLHPNGKFLESTDCQALMQLQFDCISRGNKSLLGKLKAEFPDEDLTDYVLFCSLRTAGELTQTGPVSEQVYVHSKVLIVDDRVAIVGSANVNDRSMSGDRDSEIACRVVDHELAPSRMGGAPYQVGTFAHSLRVQLWREHLGMVPLGDPKQHAYAEQCADALQRDVTTSAPAPAPSAPPPSYDDLDISHAGPAVGGAIPEGDERGASEGPAVVWWDDDVSDFTCAEVWRGLVAATATANTTLLESAFDARAWNDVATLAEAQRSVGITRSSLQVTVPEPTPEMLAALTRASLASASAHAAAADAPMTVPLWTTQTEGVRQMLRGGQLKGRLVLFPHHFLHGEDLDAHIAARFLVGKRLFQ